MIDELMGKIYSKRASGSMEPMGLIFVCFGYKGVNINHF